MAETTRSDRTAYWARSVQRPLKDGTNWSEHKLYLAEIDNEFEKLQQIKAPFRAPECGVVVASVVRNEIKKIASFFDYYRSMGIKHFVFVDNNSTDGTFEYLCEQDDVDLYRTADNFRDSVCGCMWTGSIIRRKYLNRWILSVDCDEFFVFDQMENKKIDDLVFLLDSLGIRSVYAPLIDMYPSKVSCEKYKHTTLIREFAPYFDSKIARGKQRYWWSLRHSSVHLSGGPRNNQILGDMDSADSVAEYCLDKTPLLFWDSSTCYPVIHYPWPPLRFNRYQFAALLHYKFIQDFDSKLGEALVDNQHWNDSADYRVYSKFFGESDVTCFHNSDSILYRDSQSLKAHDLLTDIDWQARSLGRHVRLSLGQGKLQGLLSLALYSLDRYIQAPAAKKGLLTPVGLKSPWKEPSAGPDQHEIDQRTLSDFRQRATASFDGLVPVKEGPKVDRGYVDVYCTVFNEIVRLPLFLSHYRKMGVRRFVIVDNNSDDGSFEYLQDQEDVALYHTTDGYQRSNFGQCWIHALVNHDGIDRWVLYVDADELLVYDRHADHDLVSLTRFLEHSNLDRLYSMMLDLYSEDIDIEVRGLDDLEQMYFDPLRFRLRKFYSRRKERRGTAMFGGPRARLFQWEIGGADMLGASKPAVTYLNKSPLMWWTSETAYEMNHFPYPWRNNEGAVRGILLHLKFLSDFKKRAVEAVSRMEHWGGAREHHSFLEALRDHGGVLPLMQPWSRQYRGAESLISANVLSKIDWNAIRERDQ